MLLAGCSAKEAEKQEKVKDEAASLTASDVSETTTEESSKTTVKTTTTETTTTAKKTATKTTTAKITTTKTAAATQAATTKAASTAAPQTTSPPAPVKHYTAEGLDGPEEISEPEWNALTKLNEKYGQTFKVLYRNLCWESWPKTILNDDGTTTTIPVDRDPNEPLNVVYVLEDSDGVIFGARIKENTDIITHDDYIYERYKEQLHNEAAGSLQKLVPGGKVLFNGGDNGELPFECPADMTYEEFRQAFADNDRYVFCNLFVAEGMEVSDDMRAYSPRRGDGHRGEYGYLMQVHVNQVSQEDYDRLDDIITEYPKNIKSKLIN